MVFVVTTLYAKNHYLGKVKVHEEEDAETAAGPIKIPRSLICRNLQICEFISAISTLHM